MYRIIALILLLLTAVVACTTKNQNLLSEIGEKEIGNVSNAIGTTIPLPHYLPQGYQVQRILQPESHDYFIGSEQSVKKLSVIKLIISDRKIEGNIDSNMLQVVNGKSGLFEVAGENALQLDIVYWQSYPFSWKSYSGISSFELPEQKEIFDGAIGYFDTIHLDATQENIAWLMSWTLPNNDTPEFVLTIFASKTISEAELVRIARSIQIS